MSEAAGQAREAQTARPVSMVRMITAATIGNALEFYDFQAYAFFASQIAASFFPGHDPNSRLLLTFGTFGVSFLARPVGAVVLGNFADRRGRAACMMLAVALMTIGCLMITLMPSHDSIGLLAPAGILLARLIQGFSLGGEFGSSTAFMMEHGVGREARAASWQSTSQLVASVLAIGVALSLQGVLPSDLFHRWGFRIAFAIGTLLGPVGLLLRRGLEEAPAFREQQRRGGAGAQGKQPATVTGVLIAMGLVALGTGQTYLTVYLPTYATTHLQLHSGKALGAVLLLYVVVLLFTPLRLYLADRFDRNHSITPMLVACLVLLVSGYPTFMLLNAFPTAFMLFLLPVLLNVLALPYLSPLQAYMGMVFPLQRRGLGLSVAYALGVALFGGFAPFINTWLVSRTGDARSPGLFLAATAVLSLVALLASRTRVEAHRTQDA